MSQCDVKNERCGFLCTGYEGSTIWKEFHELPKKIDCESCSGHADYMFKGFHDHFNAGLGKVVFDKSNYEKFVKEVNCVYDTCVVEGRC